MACRACDGFRRAGNGQPQYCFGGPTIGVHGFVYGSVARRPSRDWVLGTWDSSVSVSEFRLLFSVMARTDVDFCLCIGQAETELARNVV